MKISQVTMVLAVLATSRKYTEAYTMDYYDCNKPTGMREYDLRTYCMNEKPSSSETTTYHVLQKRKSIKMTGFSCQRIRSTFTMHCGMFSHQELLRIPDIEIKQDVSLHQCQNMITTGYWTTREGTTHKIKVGEESIVHVSEKGVLHEDSNKIWCEGEDLKMDNNIIEGVMKMVQYRTIIEEEKFIVEKKRVEVINNHVKLQAECTVETGGCIGQKTYLWNPPSSQCPLVKINTGKFVSEQGWIVEHNAKLLFKISETGQAPFGCPPGDIYHTEYADLYLTKEKNYPHIDEAIEIGLYVKQSSDYVLYEAERLTMNIAESTYRDMCKQLYEKSKDEVIPMTNGKFGRRSGDILYTFGCVKKTGKLMASRECHDRIPLESNIFVDSTTRIGTRHATIKECNDLFPEAVRVKEGWVSLPNLKPIQEPSQFQGRKTNVTHEDMSRGGLYTTEEIEQWEKFISYGDFRESILSSLSTGACVHREICKADKERQLPSYNLNKLLEEVREEMNPMSRFKETIKDYGAYLSACVIFSWICRVVLWAALLFNTIIREGRNVAVALLYATCCGTLYKTGKIRRHNNKRNTPSAPPAQELQTGLLRPV